MQIPGCLMTIFGATGDLTHRKLIPAIYQLHYQGLLPEDFAVLAVGRKDFSAGSYLEQVKASAKKYTSTCFSEECWSRLENRIEYVRFDFLDESSYSEFAIKISEGRSAGKYAVNDIFYLAVSPDNFAPIVHYLDTAGLIRRDSLYGFGSHDHWQRFVIEKPFGRDLASAAELNHSITSVIPEECIYRIDHYLAKEMIQNITMLRRQNSIFEPLWNRDHIDNVQISVLEQEGVGFRGGYYDQAGAVRDMVQNHLLQVVAVIAMDLPHTNEAEQIRNEKVRLLKSLHSNIGTGRSGSVVLGQYRSYRTEERIDPASFTETFAALKLSLDNDRWRGVPFYLVTGKKMAAKSALVSIEFRKPYSPDNSNTPANLLQIGIQPLEGIHLRLNIKKPTVTDEMDVAEMEYCQSCQYDFNSPDSYEKLLLDVMVGDSTRFTRWDELQLSWKLTDEIMEYCREHMIPEFYKDGSCGPQSAAEMIRADGRRWWHLEEDQKTPYAFFCRVPDKTGK